MIIIVIVIKFLLVIWFAFESNVDTIKHFTVMFQAVGMLLYGIWIFYVWNYMKIVQSEHMKDLPYYFF